MNRKGEVFTVTIVVIIIAFFLAWLINLGYRECNSNDDCGSGYYCDVGHTCNQIPVLEKEIVIQNQFLWPSIILGVAIVAAAVILRHKRNDKKEAHEKLKIHGETPDEPYVRTNF